MLKLSSGHALLQQINLKRTSAGQLTADVNAYRSGNCMRLNSMRNDQVVADSAGIEPRSSLDIRSVRRWAISLTSFTFIVLQSVCSLVMALSSLRVLIGLGALAAVTTGAQTPPGGLHRDAIRIPMMILAVIGSLVNLYIIWRVRSLRKSPSSQWRQQTIPRKRILSENAQIAMAILTLVLVAAEFFSHFYIFRFVG